MGLPIKIEKEIYKLQNKRYRKELYKYLLEGVLCITELLNARIIPEYIVRSESFEKHPRAKKLLDKIAELKIPVYIMPDDEFKKIVDTVSPQGILCSAPMQFSPIEPALNSAKSRIIVLDTISDPGNLGTIIRTAVAFNMSGLVILSKSVELYNTKVIRSALGSHLHIPIISDIEPDMILQTLKQRNFKIYATSPKVTKSYTSVINKNDEKIAIVIGNEHHGISEVFINDESIEKITVPISDKVESLNAAVTSAIVMSYLSEVEPK